MEKQDEYSLSMQRTKIMMSLKTFTFVMFLGLFLLGIAIFQNAIQIEQIFQVLKEQFPNQELYSVLQYIGNQNIVNLSLYVLIALIYTGALVWLGFHFHKMMKGYNAQLSALSKQLEVLQQLHPLTLPKALDTECAQKYLQKAIDANLIVTTENGLRRVPENCNKTQLVYLLGRIYCQNKTDKLPNDELCKLFNETRLEKINYDIFCNNNGKPAHSEIIDALFDE